MTDWKPIEEADQTRGTRVWAVLKGRELPDYIESWRRVQVQLVRRYPGWWAMSGPSSSSEAIPDKWVAGWVPLPDGPEESGPYYFARNIDQELAQEPNPDTQWMDQFDPIEQGTWASGRFSDSWALCAKVTLHDGDQSKTIKSPGTRGIRRDSSEEYRDTVFEHEKEILKTILRLMGAEERSLCIVVGED